VDQVEYPEAEDGGQQGTGGAELPAAAVAASHVAGAPTPHYAAPTGPTGPTGKRRRGLAVGAVVVALVAAVGILVGVTAGSHSAAPPAPGGTPNQVVLTAIDSTLGARTADLHLVMAITVPGKGQITATGDGSEDFATNAAQLTVAYGGQSGLGNERLTERFVGGNLYLSMSQLSTVVPGKTWLTVPVGGASVAPGSSNPASMIQVLEAQGDVVTPLGASVVDGSTVEGYHVVVSEADIEKRISQEDLPAALRQAAQVAKGMFGPGGLAMDVYVSDANHLLARLTMDLHMTLAGTSATATVTEDTSNYGVAVDVAPPPPDQVISYQDFLQAAASSLTGGASGT
jgi:hypothetical protein